MNTDKNPYISETELRRVVTTALLNDQAARDQTPEAQELREKFNSMELSKEQREEVAKRWIDQQVKRATERGYLMTDQQYADFYSGRGFQVGDMARYIGVDREEELKGNDHKVMRKNGQLGKITQVYDDGKPPGKIVTFRPLQPDPETEEIVELVVREWIGGFLSIERVSE